MLRMFNGIVEPKLLDSAKNILKPRNHVSDPMRLRWFEMEYSKKNIESISVLSENRKLTAHKLRLNESKEVSPLKIAIIYVCGNAEYAACALPGLEPLLNEILKESIKIKNNTAYTIYCQDYRGKGYNQKDENENFNDYPLYQDAKDQAVLIKRVLEEGFFPENIFILGHSLGSAVSLWALDILMQDYKIDCKKIKIYCDRGYGNLLDFPSVKVFLSDQKKTYEKLVTNGLMPAQTLHDIVMNLPNCFIYCAEDDNVIPSSISLVNSFQSNEIFGRAWMGEKHPEQKINSHLVAFTDLQTSQIPELKPQHLMASIIHQVPIKLNFDFKLPEYDSYVFTQDAKKGSNDYIEIPKRISTTEQNTDEFKKTYLVIDVKDFLVTELDKYIKNRTEIAMKSGYGAEYKKGLLGIIGWTAKEQVQMAIRLMVALCEKNGPDLESLNKIKLEEGPHKSGELNIIYKKIVNLIYHLEQLQFFNLWIVSMDEQRKEHKEIKESKETKEIKETKERKLEHVALSQPKIKTNKKDFSGFFRPSLIGLGAVAGGLLTYGVGGAAIGAFAGYLAPEAAVKMRKCCKKR